MVHSTTRTNQPVRFLPVIAVVVFAVCGLIAATGVSAQPGSPSDSAITAEHPSTIAVPVAEDLVYFALSAVIVVLSIVALIVVGLRRRVELTHLSFGCMSLAIGLSFLLGTSAFGVLSGGNPASWAMARSILWYLIIMSAFAFVRCYSGPGRRSSLHVVAWGNLFFGCAAIVSTLAIPEWQLREILTNVVIILSLLTILINSVRPDMRSRAGQRILAVCCIGGIQYFILESLTNLNVISFDLVTDWSRGLIFYSSVGMLLVAVYYIFAREEKLAAVRQELDTARQIQTSILPKAPPAVAELDIATRYSPVADVAGDFYDFVKVGEAGLGILVADVSGHGISAALIASMVKVAFLAQADQANNPTEVLTGLNRVFAGQVEGQFITAGYAYLDLDEGRIHYAGAAHPPMLILPAGGYSVTTLEENGLMLGPFPDATYNDTTYPLNPGDRVVMYTDGIVEAVNSKGVQFGDERFHRFLVENSTLNADTLASLLLRTVEGWAGVGCDDDLTVVIVDYVASG